MPAELIIAKAFVPWLQTRDVRLASKVFPFSSATPPTVSPYCTYLKLTQARWYHTRGHVGVSRALVQFDFWSTDHLEVQQISAKIAGDRDDPGLDKFQGVMTGVTIQTALRQGSGDGSEPAEDGSETVWYRVRDDYLITWEEG